VRAYSSNVAFEMWRSRIIGSAALQESAGSDGSVGAKRGARRRCFETKRGGRRGRDAATEDKEVFSSFASTETFQRILCLATGVRSGRADIMHGSGRGVRRRRRRQAGGEGEADDGDDA
jgi:hypothetical protein